MNSESLMAFSNVFENTLNQCMLAINEINEYLAEGFFKKEEVEPLFNEIVAVHNECKAKLNDIRAEMDLRLKSNFNVKYSLSRVQGIFSRYSEQVYERDQKHEENLKRLKALQDNLKVEEDDNSKE